MSALLNADPLWSFLRALPIRRRRGLTEWMTSELIIPEGRSRGALFAPKTRAWVALVLPEIENGLANCRYRSVTIAACPRAGKSLLAFAIGLWRACEYGDSVQFVAPDLRISHDFFKDKIEKSLVENPRLRELLPAGYERKASATPVLRLRNNGILRNIFNPASIRSYDASVLIATEAAQFAETENEGDTLTLAERRQDDHPGGGIKVFESTHTRDATRFAREVREGTDSRLEAACPRCGVYIQPGRREDMRGWDVDDLADFDPHQICPECEGRLGEEDRPTMLATARLVHTHPDAKGFSVTIGWWWTDVRSYADVCHAEHKYRRTKDRADLRDLLQSFYAVPVTRKDEEDPDAEKPVGRDTFLARRAAYAMGDRIPQTLYTTAAIDVQKNWLYYLLMGFGVDFSVYFLEWGSNPFIPDAFQRPDSCASQELVLKTLDDTYQDLNTHTPLDIVIDGSYKHAASHRPLIREWAAGKRETVRFIRGRADTEFGRIAPAEQLPASVQRFLRATNGNGLIEWMINVDQVKTLLFERMRYPVGSTGAVHFPRDLDESGRSYLMRHLLAEKPVQVIKRGVPVTRWRKDKGAGRWDLLDCSGYCFAFGLLRAEFEGLSLAGAARGGAAPDAGEEPPAAPVPETPPDPTPPASPAPPRRVQRRGRLF